MKQLENRIKVSTQQRTYPRQCEAFDVFRGMLEKYGEQSAFLLDSITDIHSRYCSSVVGFHPIVSVRIKNQHLKLQGEEAITAKINQYLQHKGIATAPFTTVSPVLDTIQDTFEMEVSDLPPYSFGYLGFFSYDAIRYFEDIPNTTTDDRNIDDIHLQVHQVVLHFEESHIRVLIHDIDGLPTPTFEEIEAFIHEYSEPVFEGYDPSKLVEEEDVTLEEFLERVRIAKNYIREGDIFQIQVSKRDRVIGEIDTMQVYHRLKQINPSPYMFYVDYGEYKIFGASPEVQLRLENNIAQMRPIAGTSKGKGKTIEENQKLIDALINDEKEQAEHLMLVDLCRNDLGRVSKPGTVEVSDFMVVEEYSHVYHIVSTVQGEIEPQHSRFDVFLFTFPAGTLTGAPKVRAMEIIDELETVSRGPYGGVLGFIDFQGNINTAIIIRTVVHKEGVFYFQAAAGIVADSDPMSEWNECNHKLRALKTTVFKG